MREAGKIGDKFLLLKLPSYMYGIPTLGTDPTIMWTVITPSTIDKHVTMYICMHMEVQVYTCMYTHYNYV